MDSRGELINNSSLSNGYLHATCDMLQMPHAPPAKRMIIKHVWTSGVTFFTAP